jgi:hypothetical protein
MRPRSACGRRLLLSFLFSFVFIAGGLVNVTLVCSVICDARDQLERLDSSGGFRAVLFVFSTASLPIKHSGETLVEIGCTEEQTSVLLLGYSDFLSSCSLFRLFCCFLSLCCAAATNWGLVTGVTVIENAGAAVGKSRIGKPLFGTRIESKLAFCYRYVARSHGIGA